MKYKISFVCEAGSLETIIGALSGSVDGISVTPIGTLPVEQPVDTARPKPVRTQGARRPGGKSSVQWIMEMLQREGGALKRTYIEKELVKLGYNAHTATASISKLHQDGKIGRDAKSVWPL